MNFFDFTGQFAQDLRFTYNVTNILLWFMDIMCVIGTIWMFKEDKPKSERFWFATGIFFSAVAILLGRNIDLMREGGAILVRNAHLLTTFNLSFIFVSGIFYLRALTQHWIKDLWRWVLYGLLGFSIVLYFMRVMVV